MAYQCKDCGVPVAWSDRNCPACGADNPQGHSSDMRFVVILYVLLPIVGFYLLWRIIHFVFHL
jgi:hypothetical protein